jgi:hypothetical protein
MPEAAADDGGGGVGASGAELGGLVDAIRALEHERNRLRNALERIVEIIDDVT